MVFEAFKKYLSNEGYGFETTGDSLLSFKKDGLNFLLVYDSEDPYYFRLILPRIWKVEENDVKKVTDILNKSNLNYKVIKAYTDEDSTVWSAVEQFIYSSENINVLFKRAIILQEEFHKGFMQKMKQD